VPTGYTATLNHGEQTFPDFALHCARAFGALVSLRDESSDTPIPEVIEPSPYELEYLEKTRVKLFELTELSFSQWADRQDEELAEQLRVKQEANERSAALRVRYEGDARAGPRLGATHLRACWPEGFHDPAAQRVDQVRLLDGSNRSRSDLRRRVPRRDARLRARLGLPG
jgi:hypothetical protein